MGLISCPQTWCRWSMQKYRITYVRDIPWRFWVALQIFFATFMCYMLRVNMSIIILAMVEPTPATEEAGDGGEVETTTPEPMKDYGQRFDWNKDIQGLILGSYFWGYLITSGPGGILAERYGPARVTWLSMALSSLFTLVTPLCAKLHYSVVIVDRFILGLMGGVLYPALQCVIARYAVPAEKGKFVSALMGNTLGTVMTWPLLGIVMEHWGWILAFIVTGAIGLVWTVTWWLVVADSPEESRWMSDEEKQYISDGIGGDVTKTKKIPPYLDIFCNLAFYALLIAHFGNLWGLYLLLTVGPMYMKEALDFNLKKSGALAALPYLARLIFGLIFGQIGDFVKKREGVNMTYARKFFIIFSHIIPGLLLWCIVLVGRNAAAAVSLVTFSLGFNGASTVTVLTNSQDLAPNFAGTIYGIVNAIGGTSGFITPSITTAITSRVPGLRGWHIVFLMGGGIYILCGIVFILIGTAKKQDFNEKQLGGATAPAT